VWRVTERTSNWPAPAGQLLTSLATIPRRPRPVRTTDEARGGAGLPPDPAIAKTLVVSDRAVEKHIANIFLKLDLSPSGDDHRRVLAVLRYLGA
jgi:hypothetical protein